MFDNEDVLDSIYKIMTKLVDYGGNQVSALNAQILKIEDEKTAKGKVIATPIRPVADESYYLQTWTDKIYNSSPGIFYGLQSVVAKVNGPAVAKICEYFVEVVMVDSGQYNDEYKRILRYTRALEELFLENYKNGKPYGSVTIQSVRPISFQREMDSNDEVKVGGISITISLA